MYYIIWVLGLGAEEGFDGKPILCCLFFVLLQHAEPYQWSVFNVWYFTESILCIIFRMMPNNTYFSGYMQIFYSQINTANHFILDVCFFFFK